eukprot:s1767_g13.t1
MLLAGLRNHSNPNGLANFDPLDVSIPATSQSTGHFSDLTLHARGASGCRQKWRLHRSVVVRSPYFQRMLTGDWDEAKKQEIDLECLEVPGQSLLPVHSLELWIQH